MNVIEFGAAYPEYAFDSRKLIRDQPRINEREILAQLPIELEPIAENPKTGGRSRQNPNQTRTHHQCVICNRVLRNDQFATPPSYLRRNMGYPYCDDCAAAKFADAYLGKRDKVSERRTVIWRYLVPQCAACGLLDDVSVYDMHHVRGEEAEKKALTSNLITMAAFTPSPRNVSALLSEAKNCIGLCCVCHRKVHAGVLSVSGISPLRYNLADLLALLKQI